MPDIVVVASFGRVKIERRPGFDGLGRGQECSRGKFNTQVGGEESPPIERLKVQPSPSPSCRFLARTIGNLRPIFRCRGAGGGKIEAGFATASRVRKDSQTRHPCRQEEKETDE